MKGTSTITRGGVVDHQLLRSTASASAASGSDRSGLEDHLTQRTLAFRASTQRCNLNLPLFAVLATLLLIISSFPALLLANANPIPNSAKPHPLSLIDTRSSNKWMAMDALLTELQVYQGFAFVTLGIQFWEHVLTLRFEWDVYRGRIAWKHGMIGYILIRYSTWASLIPTLINICSRKPIDCQGSLNAILIALSTAVIFTSLVFIIRCIAVWQKNVWVILLLGSLWIAEAVMQLTSPFRMRSRWIQGACQTWFTTTAWRFNFAYLLAECTDIVTFALAAWKLRDVRTMGVGKVLFQQSVIYIGISTALNTICLVLIYLDLSPVLSYLCSPFAMTISGILACRSFRDLQLVGQRNNPELCFVKSSGIIWASQDGGGGDGPPRGREGRLAPGARIHTNGYPDHYDGDCCTSTDPPHTGTDSFDPRQIIDCDGSHSPTHQHHQQHCSHHRPASRGRVLTPLDAVQGRSLGVAPPRPDWLSRSGLGEPTFRHRPVFTQVPSRGIGGGSGSGTGCCSSPLLGQSHKTASGDHTCSTFDGTKTTFMGFLLDEERAAFESHAAHTSKSFKPRSGAAPPRHHTSAPQINITIDPTTAHTSSTIDNKSDMAARGGSHMASSLRYDDTEEEGVSTACGSTDEKKCTSARQPLYSGGSGTTSGTASSFLNWVTPGNKSKDKNKDKNRKASVPSFDSVKMYDLERRVTTSNPAPLSSGNGSDNGNGNERRFKRAQSSGTVHSQTRPSEDEANRTPRATTPGSMTAALPRIVPRITPPRSADSMASQDVTSSLRLFSERQRQRERRVGLQHQHRPTGMDERVLSASHDALTLSDDIDLELEDAYRNKVNLDGSSHSFLSFPDASSDEEMGVGVGAGAGVGSGKASVAARNNVVNTQASSRATLHTATSCASYETAPVPAAAGAVTPVPAAAATPRCTSSDESTSKPPPSPSPSRLDKKAASLSSPASPPPAYIGSPDTASSAINSINGTSSGAPPLRPLPPPPRNGTGSIKNTGGNRSPTRERSYMKNESDFWSQSSAAAGGGASRAKANNTGSSIPAAAIATPTPTGKGVGSRPCTSDGASDILIHPAPVMLKEGE